MRFWNGFIWFRKEVAGCCEYCSGAQNFINAGEFLLKHCSVEVVERLFSCYGRLCNMNVMLLMLVCIETSGVPP